MNRPGSPGRGKIVSLVGTVGFLVLGLGGYYYLRTTFHADRLRERNLRELARMSRAIEARVNNFQKILESLTKGNINGNIEELVEERSGLRIDLQDPGADDPPGLSVDLAPPGLSVDLAAREIRLVGSGGDQLTGEIELLLPFLASNLFDTVFLATTATEEVLLQTPGAGIRLQQIPWLAAAPEEAQKASQDSTQISADETAREPTKNSLVRKVRVAGRTYQLFLQPVRINFRPSEQTVESADGTPSGEATSLHVGGLVASNRFREESRAIDPADLLLLILLLILGILVLPFIKIRTMGPWERVEVRDVFALGWAYVLASGLFGLCLGDLAHYVNLRNEVGQRLEGIGLRLKENLSQEIENALEELSKQTERFERECQCKRANIFQDDWENVYYPHLQMIAWIDAKGEQCAKWTVRKVNTPVVNVAHREYFLRVREDRTWKREVDGESKDYFLDSIRSITTGEYGAVLSMPWRPQPYTENPDCCVQLEDGQRGAVALSTRLASLDRPVLPAGVEFVVITPEGRTLFHTRQELNLAENFFEETDSDRLRSLVYARRQGLLGSIYRGRDSRLFVTPIEQTPLSLVVVLDRAYLRTVRLEAFLIGGGLFIGYVLVLSLGYVGLVLLLAPTPLAWAWPDHKRPRMYRAFSAILLIFAGTMALALAVQRSPHPSSFLLPFGALGLGLVMLSPCCRRCVQQWIGWGVFAACFTLGMLLYVSGAGSFGIVPAVQLDAAILAAAIVVLYKQGDLKPRETVDVRTVERDYVATILLILLVIGVLPGYLVYQSIFNSRLEFLTRHHQLEAAQALQARRERLEKIRLGAKLPGEYRERSLSEAIDLAFQPLFASCYRIPELNEWRHYQPSGMEDPTGVESCPKDHLYPKNTRSRMLSIHGIIHDLADQRLPMLTAQAAEMRHLHVDGNSGGGAGREAARTTGWSWWRSDSEPDVLLFRSDRHNNYGIASRLPTGLARPSWQWWMAVVLALPVLGWLVRWQSRRVFLTDLDLSPKDRLTLDKVLSSGRIEDSLLIICTRSCDRSAIERHPDVGRVDMMRLAEERREGSLEVSAVAGKAPVVCLDFFDHRLEEPEWNSQVLRLLEELVYSKRLTMILLLSRNPEDLLFAPPAAAEGQVDSRRRSERWARVLGRFVQITVGEDDIPPNGPKEESGDIPPNGPKEKSGDISPNGPKKESSESNDVLKRECGGREPLMKIENRLRSRPDFERLSRDVLIDHVREMADGYYRAQWTILSKEEKLVVAQLAAGSVVNPTCRQSLRRLVARGLLLCDPELRLMNESFGRFVREVVPASQVAAWEREGTASVWQQVRLPLILVLAAAAIFLFATQREALQLAVGFFSAVAVGVSAVFKLFQGFRKAPGGIGEL